MLCSPFIAGRWENFDFKLIFVFASGYSYKSSVSFSSLSFSSELTIFDVCLSDAWFVTHCFFLNLNWFSRKKDRDIRFPSSLLLTTGTLAIAFAFVSIGFHESTHELGTNFPINSAAWSNWWQFFLIYIAFVVNANYLQPVIASFVSTYLLRQLSPLTTQLGCNQCDTIFTFCCLLLWRLYYCIKSPNTPRVWAGR